MKEYPGCIIIDVTSNSQDGDYVKFSPFYPHCGIPVPGMPDENRIAVAFAEGDKVLSTKIAKLEIISE